MFLASACNFMLVTVYEGIVLAVAGTIIHTELVEYGDRPLAETLQLAQHQVVTPNIVIYWVTYTVVRVWHR
jgi:hypothetical protein